MVKKGKLKDIKKTVAAPDKPQPAATNVAGFAFGRQNFRLLFIGLALIFIGFILMIGGGSDDPNVFSDKIFNFRRLTLAPILVLAGYVVEIFAIMKKPVD